MHECDPALSPPGAFGCDFWGVNLDNIVNDLFKGGVTSGQGSVPSEFGFIVTNRSALAGSVTVRRVFAGNEMVAVTMALPPATDPATRGVVTIRVPWQALTPSSSFLNFSGLQRLGYHLTSTRPISVAQFNPLASRLISGSCTSPANCTLVPSGNSPQCVQGQCNYFAFSNDSSLVLPRRSLGQSYMVLAPEYLVRRTGSATGAPSAMVNSAVTIIGTEPATLVTVTASTNTLDGGSFGRQDAGTARQFTLEPYDVLQLAADFPAGVVIGSSAGNLECGNDPFDSSTTCQFGTCNQICRVTEGDLTGTTITSNKPIAVFGASSCTIRGHLNTACDHVEEQLTPVNTWGKTFVAPRSAPLRLTNDTFATVSNAGPDYYKIVAACPDALCPQGTALTLSSVPLTADVLPQGAGKGCAPGTSLQSNNCVLRAGRSVEFRSKANLVISADQPIAVGQFFAGQDATTGTLRPSQGDPSFTLLPAAEQWSSSLSVVTPADFRDNYLSLVVDDTQVESTRLDGVLVTAWSTIAGTNFKVSTRPVSAGLHQIETVARSGANGRPGVGVTAFGFDSYVSYGYPGASELTVLNPALGP